MSGQSPYVLNIVELQNVQNSATGLTDAGQIADMIDTTGKNIRVNLLRAYDNGATGLSMSGTTATLSNTADEPVDLKVYGNVYASNFLSLCPLRFWVGGGNSMPMEAMHITEEGNVGIGTSVPGAKLDVRGDVRCSGTLVIDGDIIVRGKIRYE